MTEEMREAAIKALSESVFKLAMTVELLETKVELMQGRIDFYQEMFEVTRTRSGKDDN